MARALESDHHAFAQLFRRHAGDVHAFAQRRARSADVADDVVAAAFEKAWRSLPSLGAADGGRFRPWVFRIAANELASLFRSSSRRARREHLAAARGHVAVEGARTTGDDPVAVVAGLDAGGLVLDALATLPAEQQEVISLRYLADLEPSDAAKALGITRSHAAVRLHRAMASLRTAVTELEAARSDGDAP